MTDSIQNETAHTRASAAQCSETERSDGERNVAADARAKNQRDSMERLKRDTHNPSLADEHSLNAVVSDSVSDRTKDSNNAETEVRPRARRRRFSSNYKAKIVEAANACQTQGQIAELIRREGLYSSYLAKWRFQYRNGAINALKDDNRGRKRIRDPKDDEIRKLQAQNKQLDKKLKQTMAIIDIQKKIAALLGNPIDESMIPDLTDNDETTS